MGPVREPGHSPQARGFLHVLTPPAHGSTAVSERDTSALTPAGFQPTFPLHLYLSLLTGCSVERAMQIEFFLLAYLQ